MKKTTAPYEKLSPAQKKVAAQIWKDMVSMHQAHNRVIHDTVMVFTPNPYLIFKENHHHVQGQSSKLDRHLFKFREILSLLKISNKEAKEKDLTLNLATGEKIRQYMWDDKRMKRLGINLTKPQRDFIWNFEW